MSNTVKCIKCGKEHWSRAKGGAASVCIDCADRGVAAVALERTRMPDASGRMVYPPAEEGRRKGMRPVDESLGRGGDKRWCGKDVEDQDADAPANAGEDGGER